MKAPRTPERVVQRHIVQALRTVGATVYVLGTVHAGEPGRMTTRMTPGIPDLLVMFPVSRTGHPRHQLWIECKAVGGRLSETQKGFRDFCLMAGIPHLVGGLDVVLAYLQAKGYIREAAALYRRPA